MQLSYSVCEISTRKAEIKQSIIDARNRHFFLYVSSVLVFKTEVPTASAKSQIVITSNSSGLLVSVERHCMSLIPINEWVAKHAALDAYTCTSPSTASSPKNSAERYGQADSLSIGASVLFYWVALKSELNRLPVVRSPTTLRMQWMAVFSIFYLLAVAKSAAS